MRREKVNLAFASGDGVANDVLPGEAAVFEVIS